MSYDTAEVSEFLSSYKTRKEIEERFELSNTQSHHLIQWLRKSKCLDEICIRVSGKTNRVWYYKHKELPKK